MNKELVVLYKDDVYELIGVSYKKVFLKYEIPIMYGSVIVDKIKVGVMFKKDDPLNSECKEYSRILNRTSFMHRISSKYSIKMNKLNSRMTNLIFNGINLKYVDYCYTISCEKWIRNYKLNQVC